MFESIDSGSSYGLGLLLARGDAIEPVPAWTATGARANDGFGQSVGR